MRTEEIEGLSALPQDDLTSEEIEQLEMAKEKQQEEEKREYTDVDMLIELLSDKEDAPTVYDIEGWKDEYGIIQVSTILNEDDIYLWRILRRQEYKSLLKSGTLNEQARAEEAIVRRCLLCPKPNEKFMYNSPAGVISTLKEQIMYKSGFVPDAVALSQIKVL
jgi:hypothetical protein|nr:MAG TPA: hypothetical protein [Caudoviricetes sp.]